MGFIAALLLFIVGVWVAVAILKLLWHIATITIGQTLSWIFFALLPFLVTVALPFVIIAALIWMIARAISGSGDSRTNAPSTRCTHGHAAAAGARFCPKCGSPLTGAMLP